MIATKMSSSQQLCCHVIQIEDSHSKQLLDSMPTMWPEFKMRSKFNMHTEKTELSF